VCGYQYVTIEEGITHSRSRGKRRKNYNSIQGTLVATRELGQMNNGGHGD